MVETPKKHLRCEAAELPSFPLNIVVCDIDTSRAAVLLTERGEPGAAGAAAVFLVTWTIAYSQSAVQYSFTGPSVLALKTESHYGSRCKPQPLLPTCDAVLWEPAH
jgi:hypothetical protein